MTGWRIPPRITPGQYYGPSIFDVPNRVSLSWNYTLKGLNDSKERQGTSRRMGLERHDDLPVGISVDRTKFNSYVPVCQDTSPTAPNAPRRKSRCGLCARQWRLQRGRQQLRLPRREQLLQSTNNSKWLTGAIPKSDFAPAFGNEGNEMPMQFRGPNFFETDINVYKNFPFNERLNFQLRFEFFNLFNRANYASVDTNFPDGNFGAATGSHAPRFWQLGGRLSF